MPGSTNLRCQWCYTPTRGSAVPPVPYQKTLSQFCTEQQCLHSCQSLTQTREAVLVIYPFYNPFRFTTLNFGWRRTLAIKECLPSLWGNTLVQQGRPRSGVRSPAKCLQCLIQMCPTAQKPSTDISDCTHRQPLTASSDMTTAVT